MKTKLLILFAFISTTVFAGDTLKAPATTYDSYGYYNYMMTAYRNVYLQNKLQVIPGDTVLPVPATFDIVSYYNYEMNTIYNIYRQSFFKGNYLNDSIGGSGANKVLVTQKRLKDTATSLRSLINKNIGVLDTIPTDGGTVTCNKRKFVAINPAGTLTGSTPDLTIVLPASPYNGQEICINSSHIVTLVTFSGGTIVGAPTGLVAGANGRWFYDSSQSKWLAE